MPIHSRGSTRLCQVLLIGVVVVVPASTSFAQSTPTALRIVVVEGEDAVNVIQQRTAVAPLVEVRDRNNNPVAGAAVTFALKGGSARATLGNGVRQLVVTTDAAGRASVAVNPLTNGTVEIQANASFAGQTASTTITQTNVATAADATKLLRGGGGHTGLIVTTAALAAGAVGAWKVNDYLKQKEDSDNGCALFISSQNVSVPGAGGSFTFAFENDCTLTATSDQPWLTLSGPTSFTSNSGTSVAAQLLPVTLAYSVQANPAAAPRVAHIVLTPKIGGATSITITQSAAGSATVFMLSAPAGTTRVAASCGSVVAIEQMRAELDAIDGGRVSIVLSACGVVASADGRLARIGEQVSATLHVNGGPDFPASLVFGGAVAGQHLRGSVTLGGAIVTAVSLGASR